MMGKNMATRTVGPAAKWFDDLRLGDVFETQGRTVTDVELTQWAMFTGDMNPMHVDDVFAREHGLYGGRFPPGLMAVAVASGLNERLGLFSGTGLAMRSQTIRYLTPVLCGDTIRVSMTVLELSPHPSKARGIVEFGYQILRGDDTCCVEGEWTIVLASRAPATDSQ